MELVAARVAVRLYADHDSLTLSARAAVPLALVATVGIARTLAAFAVIIRPYLAIDYDLWFEIGMVVGQVLFQWCVLWRQTWRERFDYAGVLVLVSSIGAVLLWPLLLWNRGTPVSPLPAVIYFSAVVSLMFIVHVALVMRRKLPKVVCATWVFYRLILLLVVVKRP